MCFNPALSPGSIREAAEGDHTQQLSLSWMEGAMALLGQMLSKVLMMDRWGTGVSQQLLVDVRGSSLLEFDPFLSFSSQQVAEFEE